jgi:hypothetical protein
VEENSLMSKAATVSLSNVDYLPNQLDLQKIEAIEERFLKEEQVECPVVHRFAPGIYIREVTLPAGSFAVGHKQKTEHLNIMISGRVTMIGDDGEWVEVTAPKTFVSQPGRKIGFIHDKVVWQNIYPTEETDIEKLEEMFLEKSITWKEKQKNDNLLLTFEKSEDVRDYYEAIKEFGFTHETVQEQTLNEDDQIPFPSGGYSVQVSKSDIDGKGLFATAGFKVDTVIAPARFAGMRTPAGRYVNHSKVPNCYFVMDDDKDIYLVSKTDITGCRGGQLGTELTVDYRQALSLQSGELICQE